MEWAPYAAAIRSVERAQRLEELLARGTDVPGIIAACLRPPLYATHFHEGFGTLYTAEYQPIDGVARYQRPDRTWEHSKRDASTVCIAEPDMPGPMHCTSAAETECGG